MISWWLAGSGVDGSVKCRKVRDGGHMNGLVLSVFFLLSEKADGFVKSRGFITYADS